MTDSKRSGNSLLRSKLRRWPFFRTLLSNMDMVLFKSDIHIASRYTELVSDRALRENVFGWIRGEMQRTSRNDRYCIYL